MNSYLLSICSAVYATLATLIAIQARQRTNTLLAICCCWTALWAVCGAFWSQRPSDSGFELLDLGRILFWYLYLLSLYHRSGVGSRRHIAGFGLVAASALAGGLAAAYAFDGDYSYTLLSAPIVTRLSVCICELLLIENLYFNLPERARWHIALPCILLGALACFDILVSADSVLFKRPSSQLLNARTIALIIVAPFLVLTAIRNQRWNEPLRLSRSAVFHSATLVLSGSVLLILAFIGEILRRVDESWGWVAELSLVFAGLTAICLCLSSRSARSLLDRVIVHHLFADRYDYRVQWLTCISTLSGISIGEESDLPTRAIRAVADAVNSPSGILFTRTDVTDSMTWASSWNMPAVAAISLRRSLVQKMSSDAQVVDFGQSEFAQLQAQLRLELGPVWLGVPLLHGNNLIGIVIVGPPRVHFRVDQEVFDLLGIIGREVGTHLAEQRAAAALIETRSLHEYGKRFAFVAHDIKNVASQLGLLLSNAEHYIENPDFQRDMLGTVRLSVQKIDRLLERLDNRSSHQPAGMINPAKRLAALLASDQRGSRVAQHVNDDEEPIAEIAINAERFDAIMTHLLNNALDASPMKPVLVTVTQDAEWVVIEIVDQGNGMSPEFIRDELFSPLKSNKGGGSGIGAFQARELIREAGGELLVVSEPGKGTTMRLLFKRVGGEISTSLNRPLISATGS